MILPDGLEEIKRWSLSYTGIIGITIPKHVQIIENRAFSSCLNLKEIIFAEGSDLKTLGFNVFDNCVNLKNLNLPENLETIKSWCFSKSGLTRIAIPKNITVIQKETFCECLNLKEVILPDSIQILDDKCFRMSGITEIMIPKSVTTIGKYAFQDCAKL